MKYRKEIDGLRSVAVLPVILFHAGFDIFSGGFVGVDVFFVISGYLITTILIDELEGGRFSILRFYERRARRILPALFTVMAFTIPLSWAWMTPMQYESFGKSLMAVVAFVSNILFWKESGYFAPAAELKPLLHTWSLAVEEQYYLLFPPALWLFWRMGRTPALILVALGALLSLGLNEWALRDGRINPGAIFYLAPFRAWELLAGSLCAFAIAGRARRSSGILSGLGLAMILAAVFLYDGETPFPSLWALAPVGGSALIILFAGPQTPVARLLSLRPFVFVGLISYSAYLWHQPLFAFARLHAGEAPPQALMLGLAALSLPLAWASWRFVEQPFRIGTPRLLDRRKPLFAASAAGMAVFAAIGAHGVATDGRRAAWLSAATPQQVQALALVEDAGSDQHLRDDGPCRFNVEDLTAAVAERLRACAAAHGPGVLVFGDSHAMDMYGIAARGAPDLPFVAGVTRGNCRPFENNPACHYDEVERFLAENPGVFDLAIFEQAGFYLLQSNPDRIGDRGMFADRPLEEPVPEMIVNEPLVALVQEYLERVAAHAPVVWLGARLEPHIPLSAVLVHGCDHDWRLRPGTAERFAMLEAALEARLEDSPVRYRSQLDLFRLTLPEDFTDCKGLFWADGDHFSRAGQVRMADRADLIGTLRREMAAD